MSSGPVARFYLDEDVSLDLAVALRRRGHDALTVPDLNTQGAADDEQFAMAVRLRRILVVYNRKDFLLLHRAWRRWFGEWGTTPPPQHPGILCLPQPPTPDAEAAAELVDRFVRAAEPGGTLANRFFRWSGGRGWEELV